MIAVETVFRDFDAEVMWSLRRRFPDVTVATLEDGAAFAWAQFAAKRPPDDYALAWLKLVARREVLRLLRRWEQPIEMLPDRDRAHESLETGLEARELLRQVESLRPGQRTALTCRLLGLTYKEAQQATGRTYTWVNRHITEGRRTLMEAV